MKLVACLAYYAELPEHLHRCVSSLHGVADALVAMQGQWDYFPAVPGDNPDEQLAAVELAAEGAMLLSHASGRWPSQVAKRSHLMEEAALLGDWMLVIDADEWVSEAQAMQLRSALATSELDVAEVMLHRVPPEPATRPRPVRRLYRASTGVSVRTAHNGYVTEDGRFLHGNPAYVSVEPADRTTAAVLHLTHDVDCRTKPRRSARNTYLYARRDMRFEDWKTEREAARA